MKTLLIFLIGSAVIIAGGAVVFSMVTKPAVVSEMMVTESNELSTTSSDEMSGTASILDLIGSVKGKSVECTFVFTGEGMRSEGTGFFVDNKSRVDSLYTGDDGIQAASYMIMDTPADSMYVWSLVNGKQTGMKMSISENKKMAEKNGTVQSATSGGAKPTILPETKTQYTCKPWSPDMTVFIPPADVDFMDMSAMQKQMEEIQKGMDGMKIPGV